MRIILSQITPRVRPESREGYTLTILQKLRRPPGHHSDANLLTR